MVHQEVEELARIGDALVSLRAAIDVVASGSATRVTVHITAGLQVLSAAPALGRAAGVAIESIWRADDASCDILISAADVAPDGMPA